MGSIATTSVTQKAAATAGAAKQKISPNLSLPTREVILDTAERLFAARGVDGVALRDLAREMNLTAPSLYNHFPSKQALYDAVLERGIRPIVELVSESWRRGTLSPEDLSRTNNKLVTHLAAHPHLARLMQRALLDDNREVQALMARWLGPLYDQGVAVTRGLAGEAGWKPALVPHLALGLFGMIFAYFTNVAGVQPFAPWASDPLSEGALRLQRDFLAEAVYRLLGPRPRQGGGRKKTD